MKSEDEQAETVPEIETKAKEEESKPLETKQVVIGIVLAVIFLAAILAVVAAMSSQKKPKTQTEDVRAAVLIPPTPVEEDDYLTMVKSIAVASPILKVGVGCVMEPLVIQITKDQDLIIENNDTVVQVVTFEDQNAFSVSPGDSRTINITQTFGRGEGAYRYRCDNVSETKNVGVIYIAN